MTTLPMQEGKCGLCDEEGTVYVSIDPYFEWLCEKCTGVMAYIDTANELVI